MADPGTSGGGPSRATLALAPPLAAALIRALWATARVTWIRREIVEGLVARGQQYVMAFWHSRLLLMRYAYSGRRLAAVISAHGDGELIARTMARFGHAAVRGSSTRGGSRAMRDALRFARDGGDLAITPDGPRGPARRAKIGAIEMARWTGLPILPISLAARPARELGSWDGFEVPVPFARVAVAYGEPLWCGRDDDEGRREALRQRLEERLDALTNECRAAVGLEPWPPVGEVSR